MTVCACAVTTGGYGVLVADDRTEGMCDDEWLCSVLGVADSPYSDDGWVQCLPVCVCLLRPYSGQCNERWLQCLTVCVCVWLLRPYS